MTAVASPPNLQPLPRWSTGNSTEGLDSMSAEEVSRMFMPRKSAQRQDSSSSMSSTSTTLAPSPAPTPSLQTNGDTAGTNGDQGNLVSRKKPARGLWPSKKIETVSATPSTRPQGLATPSPGQTAPSTMSAAGNPSSMMLSSQDRVQSSQQHMNGIVRGEAGSNAGDSSALLALLPMTGTFERKQIIIPFFPDTLRIGRQTNAKTIPTPMNGYFDSKVLSRQHAEVWADRIGKIWIRDVKSSNGTFVNGQRLSPENRDSEPHELREQDTLELGIDIVSEDQKSIVHHKVSAKVELAGVYCNTPSIMDMMHVDPATGQSYTGDSMGQQMPQMRGRGGSQGALSNNSRQSSVSSMGGGAANMLAPQRQMNLWMGPITIEQVVRKLTTELKQAKQQSRDLHQTGDFFTTLMAVEPGQQKERSLQESTDDRKDSMAMPMPASGGVVLSPDIMSPFSHPPAPPPQQPLPEKPDSTRSAIPEAILQSITRTDTERPKLDSSSPISKKPQDDYVVTLMEALQSVRAEKESQGDRIRTLENALKQERKAREIAERKARGLSHQDSILSGKTVVEDNDTVDEEAFDPDIESLESADNKLPNGHFENVADSDSTLKNSASMETLRTPDKTQLETDEMDDFTLRLQARLDLMVQEMSEMKTAMETYKRRAEDAEEGRRSLAEMVINLRAGHNSHPAEILPNGKSKAVVDESMDTQLDVGQRPQHLSNGQGLWSPSTKRQLPNGKAVKGHLQHQLEKTISDVLQQQRPEDRSRMVQSAPYISMVGVVLIGVGVMTWLNGWQPGGGDQ